MRVFIRAAGFSILIAGIGELLSLALHVFGLTWHTETILANIVTGLVSGVALAAFYEMRRTHAAARIDEIAYLNHHIRNALTAINFATFGEIDTQRLEIVRDASRRIERTIKSFSEAEHVKLDDFGADQDRP